jgi:CRISPR-associated protein Csd2
MTNTAKGDENADDDIALKPGANADRSEDIGPHIAADIFAKYDVYSYRHAASILATSFTAELGEIQHALRNFSLTCREMQVPGGNESDIPKKFSLLLRDKAWIETRVQGDLLIHLQKYSESISTKGSVNKKLLPAEEPLLIKNYIDGHKIDYVKGRVAFDLEWNSKDQTFDRDLYALRAFHECGLISAGVLVTRSITLNPLFNVLPQFDDDGNVKVGKKGKPSMCKEKYGASTTWMGKLLYRLNAGRHGGCPVLVFGIRPEVVTDWKDHELNPATSHR